MIPVSKHIRIPFLIAFFFYATGMVSAQISNEIPLGTWRDHLPFNKGLSVAQSLEKVICATENGLIVVNRADNSMETLSRATGLSDLTLSGIDYHPKTNTFLVAYLNGNVDFLNGNSIINFSDIKRSNAIQGAKRINKVRIFRDYAYLCCNFGIVVIDLIKREVRSTIYPSLENPEIFDLADQNDSLFIATSKGIFCANAKDPALPYYIAWKPIAAAGQGKFVHIDFFEKELYATLKAPARDLIVKFSKDSVSTFYSKEDIYSITLMRSSGGRLNAACNFGFFQFKPGDSTPQATWTFEYKGKKKSPNPNDAETDLFDNDINWIADNDYGLVKSRGMEGNDLTIYTPEGPFSKNVFSLAGSSRNIYVAPGGYEEGSYTPYYINQGIFSFAEGKWNRNEIKGPQQLFDIISISVDPKNNDHFFASSWGFGLAEFRNAELLNIFTTENSKIQGLPAFPDIIRISASTFDRAGNLWVANASVNKPVVMKTPSGAWKDYEFSADINNSITGNIMVDSLGQKWVILPGKGMLVFSTNEDLSLKTFRRLSDQPGQGALSTNNVLCMASDFDGRVWVGTTKGVSVFYSPDFILQSNAEGWDSQRIIVNQGGFNQYLLDAEEVTAICVDGANRKWLGTRNAGLFLVSEDGTEQIEHFTAENSGIPSNNINSLAINSATGELFIGTEEGICSYRTDATEGGKTFGKVYAFPNPVRPDYQGTIAITGLVRDADVKITDVSGNLVFRTTAKGGTATWDGLLYSGERASTGVYLVFCTNDDGSETKVAKLLFIN